MAIMLRSWNRTQMADSSAMSWMTAALAVVGFALGFLIFAEYMPGDDGSNYLLLAQSLLHGGGFSIQRTYDGPVIQAPASRELPQLSAREPRDGRYSAPSPLRTSQRVPSVAALVDSSAVTTAAAAAGVTEGLATRLWWLMGSSVRTSWADPRTDASSNAGLPFLPLSRSSFFQLKRYV